MATHDGDCSFVVVGSLATEAHSAINVGSISFLGSATFNADIGGFVKNASVIFSSIGTLDMMNIEAYSECSNIQLPDVDNFICLENCICHNIGC
jgi:hypothetical protein